MKLNEQIKSADWRSEKHVPVIEAPEAVEKNSVFEVKVTLGKEIAHPNTTEHHIRYITLFFKPENDNFTYDVGHFEFNAHGESVQGANEGPVYTYHEATATMKIMQPGTLMALAYCNIHGLWQSEKAISLK